MKNDFSKKRVGKCYFLPVLGDKVIGSWEEDISAQEQRLGPVCVFPLNIDSKSKCFHFKELQKLRGTQEEVMKMRNKCSLEYLTPESGHCYLPPE